MRQVATSRQHLVVDLDQLGGVSWPAVGSRRPPGDLIADVAHLALAPAADAARLFIVGAVLGLDQPAAEQAADLVRGLTSSPVRTASTPGAASAWLLSIPLILACACGERTKHGIDLAGPVDVVGVAAAPGDEAQILLARDARANSVG